MLVNQVPQASGTIVGESTIGQAISDQSAEAVVK